MSYITNSWVRYKGIRPKIQLWCKGWCKFILANLWSNLIVCQGRLMNNVQPTVTTHSCGSAAAARARQGPLSGLSEGEFLAAGLG